MFSFDNSTHVSPDTCSIFFVCVLHAFSTYSSHVLSTCSNHVFSTCSGSVVLFYPRVVVDELDVGEGEVAYAAVQLSLPLACVVDFGHLDDIADV